MITTVYALVGIAFAIHLAIRLRAKNPKEAVFGVLGFYIVFVSAVFFFDTIVPRLVVTSSHRISSNWSPVIDNLGGELGQKWNEAKAIIGLGSNDNEPAPADPAPIPTPVQIVPATVMATPSVMATPLLTTTQEVVTTPVPTATPTPTDDGRLSQLYADLATARDNADRELGRAVIEQILTLAPDDAVALQTLAQIEAASTRIFNIYALTDLPTGLRPDSTAEMEVASALAGSSYQVIDDGAKRLTLKCDETTVIRDVGNGWSDGIEFTLPRCYLDQFGVATTGDTFAVGQ